MSATPDDVQPPARAVPTPTTVSLEMQKTIGAPPRPFMRSRPKTTEDWKSIIEASAAAAVGSLPGLCQWRHVKFEKAMLDGVRAFMVTPEDIAPENLNRLLIHAHGGCYVLNGGEAGLTEAILMAGFGRFKVLSVDYRMPPEAYFPAALDDVVTAWKVTSKIEDPKRMAVFGTSAGGALTLALILRAKQEGLALPAAIAPFTPMSDATKTGDTFYTNESLDNVLVSRDGFCDAATLFYANGHDLGDPLISRSMAI
jgi:epsilon-lactone hydrolase